MADTNEPDEAGDEPATFGQKLDALIGVVGYQMPAHRVSGVHIASHVLMISPAQFARKRTGNAPVSEHELSKIIDHFKLGAFVDYRIFSAQTVDAFLSSLKEAGVGTYGASQRHLLCQLLFEASRRSQARVRFTRVIGPFAARGPLGLPEGGEEDRPILKVGGRVNIECAGPEGRHVIVMTVDEEMKIGVLMPSLFAPETLVGGKTIILPAARDFDTFCVRSDPGQHRLYALWADDLVAQVVRRSHNPSGDVREMDDATAGALTRLLASMPARSLETAICDYVVRE